MPDHHNETGLLGSTVRIEIPQRRRYEEETGTVTGIGLPLVRVRTDGRVHYRHIDDVTLATSIR